MKYSSFNEIICPFENEWKFHKADLMDLVDTENDFALKDFENKCLNGKYYYAYNIPGLQYCICVFPNGAKNTFGRSWAHLFLNGSKERKFSAECTISVKSANFSKSFKNFYDSDDGWIAAQVFCKTKEFFDLKSKFFFDGEITIKIKGIFKSPRPLTSIISAPISMEWRIKEYDLKVEMEESDNCDLFSETVEVSTFPQVIYYLSFTPNKIKDGNQPDAKVYLHVDTGDEEKIEALYDICIDSAKTFLNLKLEVGDLINDTDFIIVVGNKKIRVHKQVLKNVSPFWAEMIDSKKEEYIRIKDFSSKIVYFAVKLLYGVMINLSMENMLSLYLFAQKYHIQILLDFIEEQFIKEISPANVVYLFKFSSPNSTNVPKLNQKCIDYFIKCLKETIPIYAFESLGETFLASIVLKSLHSNFTDTNVECKPCLYSI